MKEKKNYTVYYHETPSHKRYVGITANSVKERWLNGNGYKTQLFGRAIKKYGWNNIEHHIFMTGLDREEAKQWESALIALWKTNDSQYGYNCTEGGDSTAPVTEERRRKISASLKGRGTNVSCVKPVICLETMKVYDSITIAQRETGATCISDACIRREQKKRKWKSGGYHWAHYDSNKTNEDYKKLLEQYIEEEEYRKIHNATNRAVICLETLKVYPTAVEASKDTGALKSTICNCCKNTGRYNSSGNYHWSYYDDSKPLSYYTEMLTNMKPPKRTTTPVICIETGEYFSSIAEVSRKLNLKSAVHVSNCCKGTRHIAYGYHWKYAV